MFFHNGFMGHRHNLFYEARSFIDNNNQARMKDLKNNSKALDYSLTPDISTPPPSGLAKLTIDATIDRRSNKSGFAGVHQNNQGATIAAIDERFTRVREAHIQELKSLLSLFPNAQLCHIRRTAKIVAHNLAKKALRLEEDTWWIGDRLVAALRFSKF
uniref:Uncharacterized protein n=1 Tax=Cannabis sativa TaxID=3483 RepID=A0A803PAD6_CANSA